MVCLKHIAVTTISNSFAAWNFSAQINTQILRIELYCNRRNFLHGNGQNSRSWKMDIQTFGNEWLIVLCIFNTNWRRQIDKFYLLFASVFRHWTFTFVNWPVNWNRTISEFTVELNHRSCAYSSPLSFLASILAVEKSIIRWIH